MPRVVTFPWGDPRRTSTCLPCPLMHAAGHAPPQSWSRLQHLTSDGVCSEVPMLGLEVTSLMEKATASRCPFLSRSDYPVPRNRVPVPRVSADASLCLECSSCLCHLDSTHPCPSVSPPQGSLPGCLACTPWSSLLWSLNGCLLTVCILHWPGR